MKNKVPQITFAFWLIKIAATTLGETAEMRCRASSER
jgi:uncharacterized membrane-anchored protein